MLGTQPPTPAGSTREGGNRLVPLQGPPGRPLGPLLSVDPQGVLPVCACGPPSVTRLTSQPSGLVNGGAGPKTGVTAGCPDCTDASAGLLRPSDETLSGPGISWNCLLKSNTSI